MRVIGKNSVLVGTGTGLRADGTMYEEFVYEGTRNAMQSAFYNATVSNFTGGSLLGRENAVEHNGAKSRLIIRTPDEDLTQQSSTLRIIANEVQKSLLEPPYPAAFSTVTDAEIEAIRKADKSGEAPAIALSDAAQALYELILRDVRFRTVSQPVLYIVQQIPATVGNLNLTYSDVDEVVTNQYISDTTGLPFIFAFNLPLSGSSDYDGYTYGWLKKFPQVEWTGDNRFLVNHTFEFGLWDDRLVIYQS